MQVRAFAYQDTQRYRLGTNFSQLPINRPKHSFNPLRRDGAGCFIQSQGQNSNDGLPPYYPSSFYSLDKAPQYGSPSQEIWGGRVVAYESKMEDGDLEQPRDFWERILAKEPGQQENLVANVAEHLAEAVAGVRDRAYGKFQSFIFLFHVGNDLFLFLFLFHRVHLPSSGFSPLATNCKTITVGMAQENSNLLVQLFSAVFIQTWAVGYAGRQRNRPRSWSSRRLASSSRTSRFHFSRVAGGPRSTRMRICHVAWIHASPMLD